MKQKIEKGTVAAAAAAAVFHTNLERTKSPN